MRSAHAPSLSSPPRVALKAVPMLVWLSTDRFRPCDRLAGLMVKASASGAEDPWFESRVRLDFSGSSHTSDLEIDTSVATLPGALAL